MTLTEMVTAAQTEVKDSSARAKTIITLGINEGLTLFRSKLKRSYAVITRKFDLVQNAGVYQAPEDMILGDAIYIYQGTQRFALDEVKNVNEWDVTIQNPTSGRPQYFRWISNDLFEIYPAPDANTSGGGEIRYLSRAKPLSQDDYTNGTVAVTHGQNTVVGTSTSWTSGMVGRFLRLADGNDDTNYYRITSVTDATHLTIENNFDGNTQSGKSYLIGEQPNIPQEYHFALISKGLHRYFRARRDRNLATEYLADFNLVANQAGADYTGSDVSAVIQSRIRKPYSRNIVPSTNRLD